MKLLFTGAIRALALASFAIPACAMIAQSQLPNIAPTPKPSPTLSPTPTPTPSPVPASPVLVERSLSDPGLLGLDDQVLRDRGALFKAIDHSLKYLQTPKAIAFYKTYPVQGVTRDRVDRSLRRFRQLLVRSRSTKDLQSAVLKEFSLYQSIGKDTQGTVAFTGYFEPVYSASRTPTATHKYPLFGLPPTFESWKKTLTREQIEGKDGVTIDPRVKGSELVWMNDRLQAFLVQVQGSVRLKLTDGSTMTLGFAGNTDLPYTGIGRELVKDQKLKLEDLNLPNVVKHFKQNPADLNVYLPRNQRFVFFRDTKGAPALGSLGVPVTGDRSIATDKSIMPPGALALIQTQLPVFNKNYQLEQRSVSRYMLDQDTGGAIKGPGRVDIFTGTGAIAGQKAGLVNATGSLYYLLLKKG